MRCHLIVLLCALPLFADKIAVETLACKTSEALQQLPYDVKTDYTKLSRYAGTHDCIVLSESDKVVVVDTGATGSESVFLHILVERNGGTYYVPRRAVLIEQPGHRNRFSF